MRISGRSLSGLGDYQGPSPVTLIDGTVISDPGSTPATAAQCEPYICGADASNLGARIWCSFWGQAGNAPCRPECAQYDSEGASTCAVSVVSPPAPPPPAVMNAPYKAQIPTLTPQSIVQPLPDITQVLAPVVSASCSDWQGLNGWIAENPVLAAGILGFAFGLLLYRRKRRG